MLSRSLLSIETSRGGLEIGRRKSCQEKIYNKDTQCITKAYKKMCIRDSFYISLYVVALRENTKERQRKSVSER